MRTDILEYLQNEIYARCKKDVVDADAVSHFDSVPSLLYLAYVEKKMSIEEGAAFVRGKLERSFRKLSPGSQDYYSDKYRRVMSIFEGKE